MNTIKELKQKGQELKTRIEKFGAPLGNKNAAGPHDGIPGNGQIQAVSSKHINAGRAIKEVKRLRSQLEGDGYKMTSEKDVGASQGQSASRVITQRYEHPSGKIAEIIRTAAGYTGGGTVTLK